MRKVALAPKPPRRAPLERDVLSAIRAALAAMPDVTIHRNVNSLLYARDGSPVKAGLGDGSADLVGSLAIEIRGCALAWSLAIEVKRPGRKVRPGDAQDLWLASHAARGWIVGVCSSVEEAVALLDAAREKARQCLT